MSLPVDLPTGLLVGSQWRAGADGTFDVSDPATGAVIVAVARAGISDVQEAIAAAHSAGSGWAATTPRERGEVLRRIFDAILHRQDEIAALISLEMGKARADAAGEVAYAAEFFRWFSEEAVRIDGSLRTAPGGANRILTTKTPIGVCLLLTPWNFPAAMIARKIAPVLAAGCTAVIKPAEDTPLTALLLAKIAQDCGVPDGVLNVLTTDRPAELAATALADARVRKLSFTGSTAVGRTLLAQAAPRMVRTSLELGGNAPFIVTEDADLEAAVDGAMVAKIRSGGQACTAANRFLVQETVVEEFTSRLVAAMRALRLGPASDPNTALGPMIHARAVDGIAAKVEAALAAGASLRLGGERLSGPGSYYPATVVTDVPRDAALVTEEIFGPVASIVSVTDDADALAVANDVEVGLAAYIYSGDLARALRLAEGLEVGMVGINRGLLSDAAAPFGGVKQSGLGREGGYEGIEEYLETKYIAASW
jgi:succinate-semialdehyde dehydrogenase/glutarate-semialdehyde dehydrogenase